MSKGLDALEHINKNIIVCQEDVDEDINIIEKELKQAQEDKKVLNIFKNALTIKQTCVLPKEQDQDDTFSYACRYLYEITQNDIDEKLRKSLREWVLKNAFPKELKALEIIKYCCSKNSEYVAMRYYEDKLECGYITQEQFDLLKEVLL